jgi:photosystem II stability/assembly factor-like uncharacterized protein
MNRNRKSIFNCLLIIFMIALFCLSTQAAEWKVLYDVAQRGPGGPPQGASAMPQGVSLGWANQIIIHPTKSNVIYAATEGAGFVVSEDGGKSWVPKNQGFTAAEEGTVSGIQIRCIAIDPNKPDTIYAGMAAFGVYKTTDAGNKWDTVSDTLEDTFTKALAIHPAKTDTVYLGTDGGGIYRYNVQANEWVESVKGLKNTYIKAIVMDPKNPKLIYVATDGFIGNTIDGGDNWKVLSNGLTNRYTLCLTMDPKDSKVLYAGTDGGGLFKTSDGGEKWEAVGGDIWMTKPAAEDLVAPGADVETTSVTSSVVVNPANSSIVYAANASGVFRSADAGQTWAQINTGLTSTVIKNLAVNNTKPVIVYASTSDGKFFAYTEE